MYQKRRVSTYKDHLEVIRYHINRARNEMQRERDRWHADVKICYMLEAELTDMIKQIEKEENAEEMKKLLGGKQ